MNDVVQNLSWLMKGLKSRPDGTTQRRAAVYMQWCAVQDAGKDDLRLQHGKVDGEDEDTCISEENSLFFVVYER